MSNVKKPEPVAWHINKENRKEAFLTDLASDAEIHMALMERYKGISLVPLITTAQSEAYANERVREALEQAAREVEMRPTYRTEHGIWARSAARTIRALIPKQ